MTAPRAAKYYVRTGEGTDALGIAKDSWVENGGWQGLSIARLAFGKTPEEQQKINAGAQEIVDAANLGLASLSREAALVEALQGLLHDYKQLVDSGDCGSWDSEKVPSVIAARSVLDR